MSLFLAKPVFSFVNDVFIWDIYGPSKYKNNNHDRSQLYNILRFTKDFLYSMSHNTERNTICCVDQGALEQNVTSHSRKVWNRAAFGDMGGWLKPPPQPQPSITTEDLPIRLMPPDHLGHRPQQSSLLSPLRGDKAVCELASGIKQPPLLGREDCSSLLSYG